MALFSRKVCNRGAYSNDLDFSQGPHFMTIVIFKMAAQRRPWNKVQKYSTNSGVMCEDTFHFCLRLHNRANYGCFYILFTKKVLRRVAKAKVVSREEYSTIRRVFLRRVPRSSLCRSFKCKEDARDEVKL